MTLFTAFPLFLNLGSGEIFLIVILIVLFFGTDKLPEMVRGFARGMREMRNAAGEIQREIETSVNEVQRDINLKQHIDEIADSARTMANSVEEEVRTIDAANPDAVPPVTVIYNTQTPPAEVAVEANIAETADLELPENSTDPSETPPSDDSPENPLVPPHIISRKG